MEFLHIIVMILVLINIYLVYNTRCLEKFSTKISSIEKFDTAIDTAINNKFKVNFDNIRNLSSYVSEILNETELITMKDYTYLTDGIIRNNLKIDGNLKIKGNVQFTTKNTNFLNIFPKYMIIAWGDNIAPLGWAFCDGNIYYMDNNGNAVKSLTGISIPSYAQGVLTPNLQGRMVLGAGTGPGLSPRIINEKGGLEKVTLDDVKYLPSHSHHVPWDTEKTGLPGSKWPDLMDVDRADRDDLAQYTQTAGGKPDGTVEPHENMPPFYVLNYIIKL